MKKFLSILLLVCLLWGLALPAAAEGGTLTTLYVQVVGERRYSKGVTVPVGISRTVKFYIKEEAGYTEVEATPVVENSTIFYTKKATDIDAACGVKLNNVKLLTY